MSDRLQDAVTNIQRTLTARNATRAQDLTPAQRRIINRLQSGQSVYVSTVVKHGLDAFVTDPRYSSLIKFPKRQTHRPVRATRSESGTQYIVPVTTVEEPVVETRDYIMTPGYEVVNYRKTIPLDRKPAVFTKADIVQFIKEFYSPDKKTRKTYLTRYQAKRLDDFDSNDLLDPAWWDSFVAQHKYIKQIISPISTYLKHNHVGKFVSLKRKITGEIARQIELENARAIEKTKLPLKIGASTILDKWNAYTVTDTMEGYTGRSAYQLDRDGLILGLYATMPLRDDFGRVSFTDRLNEGFNFLDLDRKEITVLGKKGSMVDRTLPVSNVLVRFIQESLEEFPREFLFIKEDGTAVGALDKHVSRAFKRIFGKKVTINDIRKSFTSFAEGASPEEFIRMAKLQGHSVATAKMFYTRRDATEDED